MFQPRSLRKKVPKEPKPLFSATNCLEHFELLNRPNATYESRFRGGILLLGFLLCPTAQRKSQTNMKILISGFNVCANAHGSSREDIFLQLIERFKGENNINKGNTARKKVLNTNLNVYKSE